jgi:putative ABC transport system permease protein
MILAALRDLAWRRKRFAIALAATALVFGMSLLMSGLAGSFPKEVERTLDLIGGEGYLADESATGPFSATKVLPVTAAPDAAPFMFTTAALNADDGTVRDVALIGLPEGYQLSRDDVRVGAPGTALVGSGLGLDVGDTLPIGGVDHEVTAEIGAATLFAGQPAVIVPIEDVQALLAAGQPITRAFVVADADTSVPDGLAFFDQAEAQRDLLRPLKGANQSIGFVRVLLWIVAACIIGSVVFLSTLERIRDFAVFKATGVATKSIAAGLVLQAVVLAIFASILAFAVALLIGPTFPMAIAIPVSAFVTLPILAVVIGLLASLAGLRRAVTIDPALAFGGR